MPATALLTSEQYLALPDEVDKSGNRIKDELIGDEVVKVPPPSQLHNLMKINIIGELVHYERTHRKLRVKVLAEMALIVTPHDTFVADGSVILKSRLGPRKHKYITSVIVHTSDSVRELNAGQKIEDPLLPGFSTPVSAFFELT